MVVVVCFVMGPTGFFIGKEELPGLEGGGLFSFESVFSLLIWPEVMGTFLGGLSCNFVCVLVFVTTEDVLPLIPAVCRTTSLCLNSAEGPADSREVSFLGTLLALVGETECGVSRLPLELLVLTPSLSDVFFSLSTFWTV